MQDLHVAVAFVIGAMSWDLSGLYWFSEKFGTNPIEAIGMLRNMRSGGASVFGNTKQRRRNRWRLQNGVVIEDSPRGNEAKMIDPLRALGVADETAAVYAPILPKRSCCGKSTSRVKWLRLWALARMRASGFHL